MKQGRYNMHYTSHKRNQILSLKDDTKELTAVLQRILCFGLVIALQPGLRNNDSTTIFVRIRCKPDHGTNKEFVKISSRKGDSLVKVWLHSSLSSSLPIGSCLLVCDVYVLISFSKYLGDLNDITQTLVLRVVQGHNCYPMTWGSNSALRQWKAAVSSPAIPGVVSRREGGLWGIKPSKATNLVVLLSFLSFCLFTYLFIYYNIGIEIRVSCMRDKALPLSYIHHPTLFFNLPFVFLSISSEKSEVSLRTMKKQHFSPVIFSKFS